MSSITVVVVEVKIYKTLMNSISMVINTIEKPSRVFFVFMLDNINI